MTAAVFRLQNPVRNYAWGSHTALAELRGEHAPTVRPEAEMWLGAHPAAPSRVAGADRSLADAIAADPAALLGDRVLAAFGPRLPFLLKVLAVEEPLSLQVHPNRQQARDGFAAEQARGMAADDPARNYRDPHHKPELLYAMTPFDALCGLRPRDEIDTVLCELGVAELRMSADVGGAALIGDILRADDPDRLIHAALTACRARVRAGEATENHRCALELADRYPHDPGVVVSLLLNRIHLRPGQAMYLPPGRLHAYLHGVGIEIMASSDNVVRGGLTAKRVDVQELMTLLEPGGARPRLIDGEVDEAGWCRYASPVPDFALARAESADEPLVSDVPGPQILLCVEGTLRLSAADAALTLTRGQSVFVPAGQPVTVSGVGSAFRATTGRG